MQKLSFQPGAPEDLCQIHDYSGVNLLFKTSEVKAGIAAMSKVFGAHYPETKGRTIFVNFPPVFAKIFQAFATFIPERTRNKFLILGENDQAMLFTHLQPQQVPESLGGMLRENTDKLQGPCEMVKVRARSSAEVIAAKVESSATIAWELRVCSQEIAYQVVFCSQDGSETVVAESAEGKNLKAKEGVIDGEWHAEGPGELFVRFDNKKAWISERLCLLRAKCL